MAGLLKSLPPRATRKTDADAIKRAAKSNSISPTIKGGKGLYDSISTISAVITTKMGKYKDKYLLLRTEEDVASYFNKILQAGEAAIDTETDSLDTITCRLAGVCLYTPGHKPAYIPLHHVSYITGVETADQVDERIIAKHLKTCEDAGVKWTMHNAKFDIRVVQNQLGVKISCYWDTFLATKCLNENEPASLKDLHLKYCDSQDEESLTYGKLFEGIPFTHVPISIGYLYAAGDPIKTWELAEFQKKHLNEKSLPGPYNVFKNIEMPLLDVVAKMENRGIGFDLEYAEQLSVKYTEQLKEREAEFYSILSMYDNDIQSYKDKNPNHKLSDPVSISSPTQISILLYDIMGLTSPDKGKPRGTGEDILLELDCPISKALLNCRETSKLLTTYIDKMPLSLNSKTKRIHCSFNQYGAATGRFSSSEPNMQNIPSSNKEIRRMFRAEEGFVFISCDFS